MKLRHILAVGTASALLSPAFGTFTASSAHAVEETTLQVQMPKAVGVNGNPVEFDAKVGNTGGDTHTDARLFLNFELSEFFQDENGRFHSSALRVEYLDGDEWKRIRLRGKGRQVVGSPDRTFLAGADDETLRLRVSVDDSARQQAVRSLVTANPRSAAVRHAREIVGGAAPQRNTPRPNTPQPNTPQPNTPQPNTPQPNTPQGDIAKRDTTAATGVDSCTVTEPGFVLRSALRDVDPGGGPVGNPVASDTDAVELGGATVGLDGLSGDVFAGGAPKPFTLNLCNSSESGYSGVVPLLVLQRGTADEQAPPLEASEMTLEIFSDGVWKPVELLEVENGVMAYFADEEGKGVPLASHQTVPYKLRLGFRNGSTPGKASAVAQAILPETDQEGGFAFANFRIALAPKPAPAPIPGPLPEPKPTSKPKAKPKLTPTQPPTQTQTQTPTTPPSRDPDVRGRAATELADTGADIGVGLLGAGLLLAGICAVALSRLRRFYDRQDMAC